MPQSIILSDFAVEPAEGGWRLECRISADGFPSRLSFLLNIDPQESTVREPNWAAISLLYPAMLTGHDLVIEADLCPKLLFFMRGDLQGLLTAYNRNLRKVQIHAGEATPSHSTRAHGVSTGFSAGVDSFAAISEYSAKEVTAALRLTHLSVHNVGAWGHTSLTKDVFRQSCDRAARVAEAAGLGTLFVSTDMDDIFDACRAFVPAISRLEPWMLFQSSHTLRNIAAALACQSHIHAYLYASAYPYRDIGVSDTQVPEKLYMASIDPMLLPMMSTRRVDAHSAGARFTRAEKTALIADDHLARQLLDVCQRQGSNRRREGGRINCSTCGKCVRTMATLEAMGKLDDFSAVFDVVGYRSNRLRLLRSLRRSAEDGSSIDAEVIALQRRVGLALPAVEPGSLRRIVRQARRMRASAS